jgi:Carbohydrate family 9 binding domain-like
VFSVGVLVTGKPNFELIEQLVLILFYIVYFRSSEWHKFIASSNAASGLMLFMRELSQINSMTISKLAPILLFVLASVALEARTFASAQATAHLDSNQYLSSAETIATYSANDFAVDGNLSKAVWKHAKWIEFDHDPAGKTENPSVKTRVAAVWSARYVYLAFSCRYESLNVYEGEDISKERWELWNRDVVEVFVNPWPERISHYYEFEVAPNNQWIDLEIEKTKTPFNDASWNSGFEHATKIDEKGHLWMTEMRILLSSLGVEKIRDGDLWRVNFFRTAGRGGDEKRTFLAWSLIPQGGTFHVPNRFGILRFVK